jgi:hypothetical protein
MVINRILLIISEQYEIFYLNNSLIVDSIQRGSKYENFDNIKSEAGPASMIKPIHYEIVSSQDKITLSEICLLFSQDCSSRESLNFCFLFLHNF